MSVAQSDSDAALRIEEAWRLQRLGRHAQAEAIYRAVLQDQPNNAIAWHNLGLIAAQAGAADSAIALFRRAVGHAPGEARFHANLAQALRGAGQFDEAVAAADRAIRLRDDLAHAYHCRALAQVGRDRHEEALADFDHAVALGFDRPDISSQRGQCLAALGRYGEALADFEAAIAGKPDDADLLISRSIALFRLNRFEDALADCDAAIRLREDAPSYWNNRGNVLAALGRADAAQHDYDRAIALNPAYADPYVNKGIALLQQGNFEHGWFYFEWRWKREAAGGGRKFKQPLWLGKTDLRGRTIFLHSEQGLGDTLQFFRYAPLVRMLGARVLLGVQPSLKTLIQRALPDIEVYAEGELVPPFDLHCPLMSLPLACGTRRIDLIPPSPGLSAPEGLRRSWARRLGACARIRAGLVWQGNPAHQGDVGRSIPLEMLAPLRLFDMDLVSLQKSVSDRDADILRAWGVPSFADEQTDFTVTAALIDQVDLVISVDTAVAHLAGAMGKIVCLLLPRNPDFRWLLGRDDSPWHPTMRIFRQGGQGGWPAAIAELAAAIS
jgi:tetratricopeptide (TPR) repeat protein